MKKITTFFLLMLMIASVNAAGHAATLYVSPDGDDSDGQSWTSAFTSVRSALDAATAGDEIWVKQGTYVVDSASVQLTYVEGVDVFGGFDGTETDRSSRSTDASLTVITHADPLADGNFRLLTSSDLNELTTWDGLTFDGNNLGTGVHLSGNCVLNNAIVQNCVLTNGYGAGVRMTSGGAMIPVELTNTHVIHNTLKVSSETDYMSGGAGIAGDSGAEMLKISDCNVSHNTIEGISSTGIQAFGAGIRIYEGSILNTVINDNHLINSASEGYSDNKFTAAGINIVPQKTEVDANDLLIEGCSITSNTSPSRGGGIVIDPRWSGEYHGNYTISKTFISNNQALLGGGILTTLASAQPSGGYVLNIENTVIANNSASNNAGGGIFINASHTLNITNSTIVNNYADRYGGGGLFLQGTGNQTIPTTLKNVLAWGNEAPNRATGEVQFKINGQAATIIFSAVQEWDPSFSQLANATMGDNINLTTANSGPDGPAFVNPSSSAGYDANADVLSAEWRITENSACVDFGDNYLTEDIEGTTRPLGDWSDIGAYEYDPNWTGSQDTQNTESQFTVYSSNSAMVIKAEVKGIVNIYDLTGRLVKTAEINTGENYISVAPNKMYILKLNEETQKVMVR